ncbi:MULTISPECIES: TetR/AcrR family transcriptional regulator [Paenibacillus]|jgi:AcrR family transcriptional regulator|uniref:TetR/AcrR family transcriptional regulator n=1 Tax=Paenibacillus TaxID=44249 RepID=UPI0020BDDAD0|nr:TetR/AcrR family transcriptional regulator [Paenibacillus odorifer]
MATKVHNIRLTQTKQSLIDSFLRLVSLKDFEKITIVDITKGAKVNRATFYAHFNDKYELLDYIMGDSASAAIVKHTEGEIKFDQEGITQLVLSVFDFYQQPNIQCRSSYIGMVVPQLKEKIINELKVHLSNALGDIYPDHGKSFYVPIIAQMIHEGVYQWVTGNNTINQQEVAERISSLVLRGLQS